MAITPEGEAHLRWCADQAIPELEVVGPAAAVAAVLSDFQRSPLTAALSPLVVMIAVESAAQKGPDELRTAIMGFRV